MSNNLYSYGLVPIGEFGGGSFYAPFDTNHSKALVINPGTADNFEIPANTDFYISFWVQYGTVNVTQLTRYPIVQYGSVFQNSLGWEFGIQITSENGSSNAIPYFAFSNDSGQIKELSIVFNGSNGNLVNIGNGWNHLEVSRINGQISFTMNGYGSDSEFSRLSYNGAVAGGVSNAIADGVFNSSYAGIYVGSQQPYIVNGDNGAYIDELFMARGIGHVINTDPETGEINDGAESTTVFLYHFNENYIDTTTQMVYLDSTQLYSSTTFNGITTIIPNPDTAIIQLSSTSNIQAYPTISYQYSRPYSLRKVSTGGTIYFDSVNKEYGTASLRLPGYENNLGGGAYLQIYGYDPDTQSPPPNYYQFLVSGNTDFIWSFWINIGFGRSMPGPISLISSSDFSFNIYAPPNGSAGYGSFTFDGNTLIVNNPYFRVPSSQIGQQWTVKRSNGVITLTIGSYSNSMSYTGTIPFGTTINIGDDASNQLIPFNIDELFFAIGTSEIQSYNTYGQISDGSLSTTQFLYHFDQDYIDDMSGPISLDPTTLYSTTSILVNNIETKQATAQLTSNFTETVSGNNVKLLFRTTIASTSSIHVIVGKISSIAINLTAFTTEIIIAAKSSKDIANFSVTSQMHVVSHRIAGAQSTLTSNSTLLETNIKTVQTPINLLVQSGITVYSRKIGQAHATLNSTTNLTSNDSKQSLDQVHLSSSSTLRAVDIAFKTGHSSLSSRTDQFVLDTAIKDVQANLDSTTNFVCRIGINANLTVRSSMNVTANVTRIITSAEHSNFNLIGTINRLTQDQANLSSTSVMNIVGNVTYLEEVQCALSSTSTFHATYGKIKIDTNIIWYIAYENRTWQIEYENRDWLISPEI